MPNTDAERLLIDLGIREPSDIELCAIALTLGLRVKKQPLTSCEARLVADGNNGIVTLNKSSNRQRQRFSLGHEIGHWLHHRGRILMCHAKDITDDGKDASRGQEKVANAFASNLLMPNFMFSPCVEAIKSLRFEECMALATKFDVSVTAATRKVVLSGKFPAVLACYNRYGKLTWHEHAPQLGNDWFPVKELHADSRALAAIVDDRRVQQSIRVNAGPHFERRDANKFEVQEQVWSPFPSEALVLLVPRT